MQSLECVLLKSTKERKKTVKINVGISNFFLKNAENGAFVWLPITL